jgi:dienelactone hydrolase
VCKRFLPNSDLAMTGAPMLIFYGTEDSYGDGKNVPALKELFLRKEHHEIVTVEYPGVSHGFNLNAPPMHYFAACHRRPAQDIACEPTVIKEQES